MNIPCSGGFKLSRLDKETGSQYDANPISLQVPRQIGIIECIRQKINVGLGSS